MWAVPRQVDQRNLFRPAVFYRKQAQTFSLGWRPFVSHSLIKLIFAGLIDQVFQSASNLVKILESDKMCTVRCRFRGPFLTDGTLAKSAKLIETGW